MSMQILTVENVTFRYGATEALKGVTFSVEAGEMFGLLGPNGAGKTTLLSILSGLEEPTTGKLELFGKAVDPKQLDHRKSIGLVTQELSIYNDLTAQENLRFFGKLYGLGGTDLETRIQEVLEWTGLQDRARQRPKTFSGGMKRRLNLGIAVIHRPKLLMLDEPTTGVDPQSRNHIFERVRELNRQGMTIIYTSHYMEEVQALCTRIGILDHGKIIVCDTLPALLQMIEGSLKLRIQGPADIIRAKINTLPGIRVNTVEGDLFTLAAADVSNALVQIIAILQESRAVLTDLSIQEPNLERVFLHLTERLLRD